MTTNRTVAFLVAALLAASAFAPFAHPADQEAAIVHVLNRLGYGPRAGDVERVRAIGIRAYIDQQLQPERVIEKDIAARLSNFDTLMLTAREIAARYESPLLQARRERRQRADTQTASPGITPNQLPPGTQGPDPQVRRQAALPLMELSQQKVLRAIYSERQLQEVLTDFWFNHFNVDARKGPERFLVTEYERDVIRPHVLGRFRDLLEATARSQAMLFYLDNWMSAASNGPHRDAGHQRFGRGRRRAGDLPGSPPPRQGPNAPRGLNENYGRELLELHTLGVDGGYTQKDVTEVARAFTGWTIANPRLGGGFRFDPGLHDDGEKVVLGRKIKPGGGMRDGEQVLDMLAGHPSTARFIATKLARRFVSDTPDAALVNRAAARFKETQGDLRAVLTVLLTSPEFESLDARHAKVKNPFEFLVSAVRAAGASVEDARPLVRAMQELGMPLYQCQPPTGYQDTADAWVNTGALVNRMNVALMLASGGFPGVRLDAPIPPELMLVGGTVSEATRATIAKASTPQQAIALTLGSPEFQRR
jgi:uncharacterized protein (DUF1800 family)